MKRCLFLSGFIFVVLIGFFLLFGNDMKQPFTEKQMEYEKEQKEIEEQKENDLRVETGNYAQFKEINEDVVFALHFSDRVLPVVYNRDNEFYMRRNLAKENSSMGTPFVDQYTGLNSKNTVVHAHSSLNNERMFTFFKYFCNQEYYEEHSFFYIENEVGMHLMRIFAVMRMDLNQDDYRDWMKKEWRNEIEFMNFIDEIKKRSLIESEIIVDPEDSIITLVTCDMSVEDGRFLVFAKEEKNEEEKDEKG